MDLTIEQRSFKAGLFPIGACWKCNNRAFHFETDKDFLYAFGEPNDLLDPHPTYLGLAENEETRRTYYQRFVCQILPGDDVKEPRWSESRYIGSQRGICVRFPFKFS